MATEADIPVPVCEARGEQVGNFVDNIIKISVSTLPLEKQNQDDKHNELRIVEGENFLKPPSIDEVHCEANKVTPDVSKVTDEPDQTVKEDMDTLLLSTKLSDQPVDLAAKEETSVEESQQNAEESNSKDGDGDRGGVPEQCSMDSSVATSEMKVGDTIDDPHMDDTTGVTQLSKDTSSDHHGTNGSFAENIELTKELLQETSLPREENEEMNVQLETTDKKSADEKPTEEDMSSNLTNKMASEQEALEIETSVEDNSNTSAEKASHENSTAGEAIITLETSNIDELQSKSDLNSSLSKEEETAVQKSDKSVTISEDYGVPSENTLSESHGDVECQSKTLEDAATDHSDPKVAETSEESSLVQVEDSQIERDEHFEEESEKLPLTEVSTGGTNDNVPAATDNVKDKDEDLKEAELSEYEQSTICTSVKEDVHTENPAESLHVPPENNELTVLSQEKSINVPPEEQSRNVTLHGNTIEAEEATIKADDEQNESLESFPAIVSSSHEEGSMNAVLKEATSDHTDEKIIDEVDRHKEVLENLSSGEGHCEVNNVSPDVCMGTEKTDQTVKDGTDTLLLSPNLADQPIEFAANEETSAKEIQQNVESNSTDKDGGRDVVPELCSTDSSVVISEREVGDTLNDPDMDDVKVVTQLSIDTSTDHHATNDSSTENVALTEEILQETDPPSEETESHTPCIAEGEELNVQSKTLEGAAPDHNDPKLAEKSEESSLVKVEDSQIEHDEHLEEESERLPLTEASTEATDDNISEATDKVKDEDEDHKEAELSESEQSTKCTLVKEDVKIENPAESLHVALDNTELSNLSQENNIKVLPEEQSSNAILHGNTSEAEEATIDAADREDSHESFPPIVSGSPEEGSMNAVLQAVTSNHTDEKVIHEVDKHEEVIENLSTTADAEGNSLIKLEGSENKREDDSGNESEKTPLPLPLVREVNDVSTVLHEAHFEDGEPKKAEFCDNEKGTESMLLKTESRTENTEDVHVNSEDTKPDLADKRSEDGRVDAAEEKEETLEAQNVPTIVPNEKMEENSFIQVDGQEVKNEEHLDKENEQLYSTKDYTVNTNEDEVIVKDEGKIEDEKPIGAELLEKDKNTESVLLTEEVQSEKPVDSLHAAVEDIKTGILEEQIPAENSRGIPSDETEGTVNDAANTKEKTQELQNVSNEDSEKDFLSEVNASEMKHETNLEEEQERPSLSEVSKENPDDDESAILLEPKPSDEYISTVELPNDEKSTEKKESLQPEDHTTYTSIADTETTCPLEEQSLAENSQTIISHKITDAADEKDLALENVATETPHEHIEENSASQVDCSEREHEECLEEDNQNSTLTEAPTEETNVRESTNIDELKNREEDSIKPELENGENIESMSVKEEIDVEKPIDSLQVKPEDIKQHDSSPDINKSIEEQISNTDPREISIDNTERESVDAAHTNEESVETKDVAKDIPDCDKEDSIPIEEVGIQNPLNEASAGNANDVDSTKITEGCLIKKEESLEPLHVAAQDIETPPLSRDTETTSLDEQSPITNPERVMDDNKEEIADDATGLEGETPKVKDIGNDISDCDKEDNIPIEEVGSQNPSNEASAGNANNEESTKITEGSLIKEEASLESLQVAAQEIETPPSSRDRETSSLEEQSPIANPEGIKDDSKEETADNETGLEGETPKDKHNIANTTLYEDKEENLQVQEDCSQLDQYEDLGNESENMPSTEAPAVSSTESIPVKEEEKVEKPTEEQILTADPQETCDKTQEKTVDAANENNDVEISIPNGDSEDNSPIEVDGLQEPSSSEVPAEMINDDEPTTTHEVKLANENAVKANLFEDEEKIECALIKEEVHIESMQEAHEDIKDTSSGQDREASHLEEQVPTTDFHGTMGDQKEAKTLDLTDLKEETLEDKNYATTPDEGTKEDSPIQVDGSLLEQKEYPEKDSESTSITDAPKDDITESTLVREVAQVKDPIDSSQVETEDIKVFAPCQDTERSSTVEQILDPEDISSNKIREKITNATGDGTQEAQDIAKSVPREDDSPNEHNTEATFIKEDVSIELPQVAAEGIEEHCLSEVRETSSQEEQILSASPGVVGEVNSCGDKTDTEKIELLNDGSTAVPTSETLSKADPRGCTETEVQVLKREREAEANKQETENDQKNIIETLSDYASKDVPERKEVNGEEEIDSNKCKEISSSPISVASEDVSTSNVALEEDLTSNSSPEPRKETKEETETEEAQKQEPTSQVSELIQDSSVEKTERDAVLCLASANDSGITEEMQKLKKVPLPAPEENIIETTDCKESDVVEGTTNNEYIDHREQDDTTKSFPDDKRPTGKEQEETVADDILPVSFSETPRVDHSPTERELTNREEPCIGITATGDDEEKSDKGNDDEKEACDEKMPGISSAASDIMEERDTDVSKNDEEAQEIKETTPSSAEGRDAENVSVEENSNYTGSLTEEKSDSKPEETKTEEENLKAEAEIQSDKAVTEDILQEETTCEKEIMKDDISSEKEQLLRIKEEVITDSHQEDDVKQDQHTNSKETYEFTKNENETEMAPKVLEEADDEAPADLEEKILTNEAIDRIPHQEEHATSIEEPTTKIYNEKAHELDSACIETDTKDSNKEGVEIEIPGRESEEQNKKDEVCSSDEVQAKDEGNLTLSEGKSEEEGKETYKEACAEAEKLDFASQTKDISECAISDGAQETPEDDENSTTENKFSEEDYPNKSLECEVSSASEDIALPKQSSEDTVITVEVQEAKAGIDLGDAVPEATGLESQEVEELNDKCTEMADTSTPVETLTISTPKLIPESTEGTPLEAEDQTTKLHDLPEELNMRDSEVKVAEKDEVVKLQSDRDISEDVEELCKESFEVSNNQNPVEGDPKEKTETSEEQETKRIQNAPVSETLNQEIEEQLERGTMDVHEEEKKIYDVPDQSESSCGADTEKVPESSIRQSSVDDTAQHDKKEGNQQIDSPLFLPNVQCSDIKTSENDLPVHVGGLGTADVTEVEASPLSLKDKHVVLEADDARDFNPESLHGDKNISTEHSQGEHEVVKPSKVEQEEECGNEEKTDQEMEGKPESEETEKPSLSDLLQASMIGTSQISDHSPTEKEPTSHTEDMHAENIDEAEHENSKTDEEKDGEEDSHEQTKSDLSSEAPVMVDVGDADVKVTPKKSHNILSGVGSKVKHSIAKVKKAITGKSSHPKPPSPKKVISSESK